MLWWFFHSCSSTAKLIFVLYVLLLSLLFVSPLYSSSSKYFSPFTPNTKSNTLATFTSLSTLVNIIYSGSCWRCYSVLGANFFLSICILWMLLIIFSSSFCFACIYFLTFCSFFISSCKLSSTERPSLGWLSFKYCFNPVHFFGDMLVSRCLMYCCPK